MSILAISPIKHILFVPGKIEQLDKTAQLSLGPNRSGRDDFSILLDGRDPPRGL